MSNFLDMINCVRMCEPFRGGLNTQMKLSIELSIQVVQSEICKVSTFGYFWLWQIALHYRLKSLSSLKKHIVLKSYIIQSQRDSPSTRIKLSSHSLSIESDFRLAFWRKIVYSANYLKDRGWSKSLDEQTSFVTVIL